MQDKVIRGVLDNRDGTVDYVIDNEKLNSVLESFLNNENSIKDKINEIKLKHILFVGSGKK